MEWNEQDWNKCQRKNIYSYDAPSHEKSKVMDKDRDNAK